MSALRFVLALSAAMSAAALPIAGQDRSASQGAPMRVYIRAGLKTHGPGQHDYPQFLADWSKLLTERGALVDGALHFPSSESLAATDVLVMYKGDAGDMTADEKARLETYLTRGGGVVSLHDTLCGPDPDYLSKILGGAKKHGEVNYTLEAEVAYTVTDPANPIVQGISNLVIHDEAFFRMTWAASPAIHVLATAPMAATPSAGEHKGEVVPQIWTYENILPGGRPYRAFVWMQGHNYDNFAQPQIQPMLLRGIAWAAGRPLEALMTPRPARGR
jgi:type 1 glutamine amidotransferase